ncbi:MAG: RDD family protein [Methanothrix sp.]
MHETVTLSSWGDRFWAWLIDVLLMSTFWYEIMIVLKRDAFSLDGVLPLMVLMFIYWTVLEGYRGQSLGKMLFSIVVTGPSGEQIRFRDAALESFGKAFLLPLDSLTGYFVFRESRQRLFNRISDTIVINRME